MPSRIFCQSSLPRAESTLLQNILAQNPAFYGTSTSGLLELIFGARLSRDAVRHLLQQYAWYIQLFKYHVGAV